LKIEPRGWRGEVSGKIKRWRENFSVKPTRQEYKIAEWFLRIYDGRTQDDVAELLAEYRVEVLASAAEAYRHAAKLVSESDQYKPSVLSMEDGSSLVQVLGALAARASGEKAGKGQKTG
jgi:uncharacterized protein YbgA (DUF1722 family)